MQARQNQQIARPASLFVLSLPRSLSSTVFNTIKNALNLQEACWTSSGEILNVDRFVFLPTTPVDFGRKFTTEAIDPGLFKCIGKFLDDLVHPLDFIYKDVTQPFAISHWLQLHRFPTIRIRRCVPDVAYAMMAKGWYYATSCVRDVEDRDIALIKGLMQAEECLNKVRGVHIDFDDLVYDEDVVREALEKLYPGLKVPAIRYIDPAFEHLRKEVLARRATKWYKAIIKVQKQLILESS
jgi:hypothetical protein